MALVVRHMREDDAATVHAIQCSSYPAYLHETSECMEQRRAVWPRGSFIVQHAGAVEAYIQSHPWHADTVPPSLGDADLTSRINAAAAAPHTYYLHDVASTSSVRGAGTALLVHAIMRAFEAGYRNFVLVAVLGQHTRWAKLGFNTLCTLDGYGPGGGVFMQLDLKHADAATIAALSDGRDLPRLLAVE